MTAADDLELGPKMSLCTERERRFVCAYLVAEGNGSEAARMAGYSDKADGAKVRAHELLQRTRVLEAIHEIGSKTLAGLLVLAITKLREIASRDGSPDQLKAVLAILNRSGLSEKTTVEVHHTGSVELNHTDAALEALAYMQSLDVPREKLIEQFGHSGLSRYEKMLAERNMKVIEHA